MRIFHIGATGYIGTAVAEKLKQAGHEIVGFARSEKSAAKLEKRGYQVYRGDLQDPESIAEAAWVTEAVVYTAPLDGEAVKTVVGALEGSGKPFVAVVLATIYGDTGDREAGEDRPLDPAPQVAPVAEAEKVLLDAAQRGVRSVSVRAGLVYGRHGGAISQLLMDAARESGVPRYIGTGGNRWAVVHVNDLARLVVLAMERAPAGTAFNAVTVNVLTRNVAKVVGRAVGARTGTRSVSPEKVREIWGLLDGPPSMNLNLSGHRAHETLGWRPEAPSIFEDLV